MDIDMNAKIIDAKQSEVRQIRRSRRRMILLSCVSVAFVLFAWQMAVQYELVSTRFLESPLAVLRMIIAKFTDKTPDGALLLDHILASLQVVLTGYLIAVVIAIPLGLFMGWYRLCDRFVRPLFEIIRPIPSIAWIPIIVLFLGIGVQAKAVIIFFGSFIAILINTYTGIRLTNPVLINVAKTCGASNFRVFCNVGIPSALPMIFAGLRIAIGASWATVVAAEMLAASKGLGYMISLGRAFMRVDLIMSGIIVIGMLGFISSVLVGVLENAILKWRPKK